MIIGFLSSQIRNLLIQLFRRLKKMSFLKKFFSCGCSETSENSFSLLPNLCLPKKEKRPGISRECLPKTSQNNVNITLDPLCSFSQQLSNRRKSPPSTLKLKFKEFKTGKANGMDWGFVVGVVNCQQLVSKLIKSPFIPVKIGKSQEITVLSSLRPRCLDCLVIYWSQLGCQYSLTQILKTQQRLLLIFQSWELLSQVLTQIDSQISILLSTVPITKFTNRLSYSIVQIQTYYVLEFMELEGVAQNLMKKVENVVGFTIEGENKNHFLNNITAPIYFHFISKPQNEEQLIKELYQQMLEQQKQREKKNRKKGENVVNSPQLEAKESKNSKKSSLSLGDKVKNEQNQSEIAYFNKKRQENRPPPIQVKQITADLEIFNYNFQGQQDENTGPVEQHSGKQSNLASPRFFSKKATSKSVDPEYESYDFFDDQIFEKYQ